MFSFERRTVLDDKLSTNREVHTRSISARGLTFYPPSFSFSFSSFFNFSFLFSQDKKTSVLI